MTAYLHTSSHVSAAPYVSLNDQSLAAGNLLVTVDLTDDHRTDFAFHDVEEIKPVLAALEKALELARQGQAELDRRAAEKAAQETPPVPTVPEQIAVAEDHPQRASYVPAPDSNEGDQPETSPAPAWPPSDAKIDEVLNGLAGEDDGPELLPAPAQQDAADYKAAR